MRGWVVKCSGLVWIRVNASLPRLNPSKLATRCQNWAKFRPSFGILWQVFMDESNIKDDYFKNNFRNETTWYYTEFMYSYVQLGITNDDDKSVVVYVMAGFTTANKLFPLWITYFLDFCSSSRWVLNPLHLNSLIGQLKARFILWILPIFFFIIEIQRIPKKIYYSELIFRMQPISSCRLSVTIHCNMMP